MNNLNTTINDQDVKLMLAFQAGREEAFVELYQKNRDKIVHFTNRFLGNTSQAEEAAQEIFIKLYKSKERYKPIAKFSTYLYKIATNHCLNIQSKQEVHYLDRTFELSERFDSLELKSSTPTPEQQSQRKEIRTFLEHILNNLPANQRAAIILCHYEGLSYKEAALALESTESAVKALIFRGRTKLNQRLFEAKKRGLTQ